MRKQSMLPAAMDLVKLVGLVIKFPLWHFFSSQKGQEIAEMPLRGTTPNISKFKRAPWLIAKCRLDLYWHILLSRKHLKVQSSISSMQILSTYFWSAFGPDVNFVQNLPDAFCIELNTCGSTAVTGADWTEVCVCRSSLCSVKNVTHWFSGGH